MRLHWPDPLGGGFEFGEHPKKIGDMNFGVSLFIGGERPVPQSDCSTPNALPGRTV